jgi:xylan 1,4-beta-xylosidase
VYLNSAARSSLFATTTAANTCAHDLGFPAGQKPFRRNRARYSVREHRLTRPLHNIFKGTPIGFTEGPHLYKRNGYYYLITAEGGTGWGHAVTMARSRELTGPYELHPDAHILTSRHRPDAELQRAGHADLVETQAGEVYMVHLCGRPLRNRGRCTLGAKPRSSA